MPYTIEQWNDHMQKVIGAMNDQATLTSLVTQASDEYTGLFATNTTLSTENEQLKPVSYTHLTLPTILRV